MEIILSEKGKKQILLNGFCYRLDRLLVNGKESWRCTDVNCKGRIHVYEDTWENKAEHSHVPHPAEGAKKAMQSKLRQKASSSNDTPRLLIQESRLNLADEAVAILPKCSSLQNKHWMADGTFKIAPQLFYQLHVIHITRNGNVFPMVYVLLQNKVQQSYERVLQELYDKN